MRDHLVASALEALHRQGFNGSAVQDITDAAGVPKGSFYNYFESKEALALEVIDRYGEEVRALTGVLSDESLSPLERLRRYFALVATKFAARSYERGCLIGNLSNELADQSRAVTAPGVRATRPQRGQRHTRRTSRFARSPGPFTR